MEKITKSRTTELDINKCIDKAGGNRYAMVVERAARARTLEKENKHSEHYVNVGVTALLELQEKQ